MNKLSLLVVSVTIWSAFLVKPGESQVASCSTRNKCKDGEGNCNTDAECVSGDCGTDNCDWVKYPAFRPSDNCCIPEPICQGGDSCCSPSNKCRDGGGDCDTNADCLSGLCGVNNCDRPRFPSFSWSDDCCIGGQVAGCNGGDSCCNPHVKCNEGEGDCDANADCWSGYCGKDNCDTSIGHEWDDDCCQNLHCVGQGICCTKEEPCRNGEGDCDSDEDCQSGLECGTNNCDTSAYPSFSDQDDCCKTKYV